MTDVNTGLGTPLKVTVTGGGPVGLTFALLLESLMGSKVAIKVYDGRWTQEGTHIVWKGEEQQNARRQQVVTIQSRQYLRLPEEVRDRVFQEGYYSEMWPQGPDSIRGYSPRNIRIAHFEDKLLELANEKKESIQLIPLQFEPEDRCNGIKSQHVLAICEGAESCTRDYFAEKFGRADKSMYSIGGDHVQDIVLGLKVKSDLPDPMAVLLTVAQNRFLLNSVRGDGFLNMRLTDEEAEEVFGFDLKSKDFRDCIQSFPCVIEYAEKPGEFKSTTHSTMFIPAMLREGSPLWTRIQGGLKLFQIKEENLSSVTAFRLAMVHRPRFTVQVHPPTQTTPGTFGFLLGDAANAIHFWPGRGLNSGIVSAISLARCLKLNWRGIGFREADFTRHEGLMAMLQYRHKSRAWRTMVTTDSNGNPCAIKNIIHQAITESENGEFNQESDIDELMSRLRQIRSRLNQRISGLPGEETLRQHLSELDPLTLRTLVVSGSWDTFSVGGEEVDVDLLFGDPDLPVPPEVNHPERFSQA